MDVDSGILRTFNKPGKTTSPGVAFLLIFVMILQAGATSVRNRTLLLYFRS